MMIVGGAGNAMLFFFLMVGMVTIGLIVVAYAAHSFLVVLEGTAAGQDEVRWPDEPMVDWLWKPVYLFWLLAFWMVPVWLLVDGLFTQGVGIPAMGFYPILLGVLWLLFPIGLFSSMSAGNRLVVFRPAILGGLARHPLATLVVFGVTGVLVVGWGVLSYYALLSASWALLPLAAAAGAAVLLVYGRLLGRLAWLITNRPAEQGRKGGKKKRKGGDEGRMAAVVPLPADPPAPAAPFPEPPPAPVTPVVEPEDEDPWAPPKPYLLKEDAKPVVHRRAAPASPHIKAAPETYDVSKEKAAPTGPLPPDGYGPALLKSSPAADARVGEARPDKRMDKRLEDRLFFREDAPAPASPLWLGVYTFPWYPASLRAWIYLSLTGLLLATMSRLLLLTWPFG
jgi:hypothetical protein